VCYIKKIYFTHAINWICEVCGYDFYDSTYKEEELDPCLLILDQIEASSYKQQEFPLLKHNNKILLEYIDYPNSWFIEEGISYDVQKMFEVGFSKRDDCITLPIRDELGNLVGVKGRTILHDDGGRKYWYIYPVPKSKILYGLDKSLKFIKEQGEVIVYESEKSVLKSWSMGFCHCVSIGGHEISDTQVLKLEKLGVDIILAFDKDISPKEVKKQADKFILKDSLYAIIPNKHKALLGEKDAPVDRGIDVFIKLYTEDKYKIPK